MGNAILVEATLEGRHGLPRAPACRLQPIKQRHHHVTTRWFVHRKHQQIPVARPRERLPRCLGFVQASKPLN